MILTRSTENIKEINWSNTNAVLDETADYYLDKFKNKITEPLLHEFDRSFLHVLRGIKVEDYIRMDWCPLELAAKCDKLLSIKNKFYLNEYESSIKIKAFATNDTVEIEDVTKNDNLSYNDIVNQFSTSELKKLGIVEDNTLDDLESIPNELSDLLCDDEIKIKVGS